MSDTASELTTIEGDLLRIHFRRFDIPAYKVFLKAKALPESTTIFHPEDESYSIEAPARFAPMLGVQLPTAGAQDLTLATHLYDDQAAIVQMALDAKRFGCWCTTGLGKTAILLEWARHVIHRTQGRVLIITMNEIVRQTMDECAKFYGDALPIHRLASRQEMREWMRAGPGNLAITNYEKWNPESLELQVISEARHLAGIILDEAGRLKTGGGKQKWALIKSCKGIEYKLTSTATPAPNDVMEFASQASFLEKMRSEGEILWTYFKRDEKTHRWTVKRHAREAFFRFMSSWSIYMRDPRKYGWRLNMPDVPEPHIFVHELDATEEQREILRSLPIDRSGQLGLFDAADTNAIQRGKLSQIAKGFRYVKGSDGVKRAEPKNPAMGSVRGAMPRWEPVHSLKPPFVANLIHQEAGLGLQVLVWTVFDAESQILADLLGETSFEVLTGQTKPDDRVEILERFRKGQTQVLLSRASMLGYGLNLQFVGSMIFSGWNDSYETYFQALRRAYRQGQLKRLRVHLPMIRELEGDQWDNLCRKQGEHFRSIEEMEQHYIEARRGIAS